MTTIVAIFDNARDVDQAVTRLARAGFEDTVFDEGIIAGEAHSLGLVFASGSAPPAVWGTPETASRRKPDHQTIVQAFKSPAATSTRLLRRNRRQLGCYLRHLRPLP
jgi:hypothetical protein